MVPIQIKPGIGYTDNVYSKLIIKTLPFWYSLGCTPNTLTTFGLISSVLCNYFIWKRNMYPALLFLTLRMYFDYADGLLARTYKQTSNFGDWYDHIVDLFAFAIPLLVVLAKTNKPLMYLIPVVLGMFAMTINLGCIEKQYFEQTGKSGNSLSLCSKMCFGEPIFKVFDNSFLYGIIAVVIIVLCTLDKDKKSK